MVLLSSSSALSLLLLGSAPHVLNGQGMEVRCGETDRLTTRSRLEPPVWWVGLKSRFTRPSLIFRLDFFYLESCLLKFCARQCALFCGIVDLPSLDSQPRSRPLHRRSPRPVDPPVTTSLDNSHSATSASVTLLLFFTLYV